MGRSTVAVKIVVLIAIALIAWQFVATWVGYGAVAIGLALASAAEYLAARRAHRSIKPGWQAWVIAALFWAVMAVLAARRT